MRDAEAAARDGWSDGDVTALVGRTRALRISADELSRLLAGGVADHGLRETVITTSDAFHASIFALDEGEIVPMHDHPSLNVICKVLRGRIRVRSFEWIDPAALTARDLGEVIGGDDDDAMVLRAAPGTLHTITALEPSAFLDLFAPYYDDHDRRCRYYDVAARVSRDAVTLREVSWEEARR